MKFYALRYSTKLKEIGSLPQGGVIGGKLSSLLIRELPMFEKSSLDIVFDFISLNNKSKLTDLINQGAFFHPGLIVSDNFYNSTSFLRYYDFQLYDVFLLHKELLHENYKFIRVVSNDFLSINLNKSKLFFYDPFVSMDTVIAGRKYIDIPSFDFIDGYRKKNQLEYVSADLLVFNKSLINRDMFFLKNFYLDSVIISERFSEVILSEKFTGFEICEVPFEVKFE